MTGIRMVLLAAASAALGAVAPAGPAAGQDIYSLQARVMQLEAKVREITTFKPVPPPTEGGAALSQRIRTLELTVAELGNALQTLQAEIEALKKRPRR